MYKKTKLVWVSFQVVETSVKIQSFRDWLPRKLKFVVLLFFINFFPSSRLFWPSIKVAGRRSTGHSSTSVLQKEKLRRLTGWIVQEEPLDVDIMHLSALHNISRFWLRYTMTQKFKCAWRHGEEQVHVSTWNTFLRKNILEFAMYYQVAYVPTCYQLDVLFAQCGVPGDLVRLLGACQLLLVL